MTNPHDKAIEAAVKSAKEMMIHMGWLEPGHQGPSEVIYRVVESAIAAYERAMWRPIEEAPLSRECEKVLIIGGRYKHITAQLSDGEWWKSQKGKIAGIPTHFRPLPPVPEGE